MIRILKRFIMWSRKKIHMAFKETKPTRYTEESACRRLARNGIQTMDHTILIPMDKLIGISLWGVIDYLQAQHSYELVEKNH